MRKLHFVDIQPAVTEALRVAFSIYAESEVEVSCGDILEMASHCVVSPANSYGFMDGGVDAAYLAYFGQGLQSLVQVAIGRRPEGMLPVGAALAVATGHGRIPYMIVAPTMEVPAQHAGRALRAVLRLLDKEPRLDGEIFCPGLGTWVGHVSPADAAASMAEAYAIWRRTRVG